MIFRAIFWIGLVAYLMPHEPDLGYGRPGANLTSLAPGAIGALTAPSSLQGRCSQSAIVCAGALSLLDSFQSTTMRSLEQVRADIEAHGHALH